MVREGLAEPSCRREASSACTVDRGGAVAFLDSPDIDMRLAGSLLPEVPVVCVLPVDGDFWVSEAVVVPLAAMLCVCDRV